jgi:SynChlorMet cassette radical SAM/SPASM protein ScmF
VTLCDPEPEALLEGEAPEGALPEGAPLLTTFYLYLTDGCNLRCRHCWITPTFVNGEPSPGEYLSLDLLKQAVAEAKPLGLRTAKLTGGEPTLHPQFVEIADYLSTEGLSLTMETNGTRIDEALARHLKEHTNLWHVSVSLDGASAASHDAFRGVKGAFDAAVRGFRALVAAGYKPQLIMSPHRGNLAEVEAVVQLAVELGAGSVKFNPVMASGRGIGMHERGEALEFEEIMELAHWIRGELQQRTPIQLILGTPLALYTVSELVHAGNNGMCHVRHILGVLGSGEMALCGIGRNVPELCFGKLGEVSVTEAWLHHPVLQELRRELDEPYPGVCATCIHAGRCLTYCVANNYEATGRLVAPSALCAEAYARGVFPESRLR